ncbi:flagellar biosynthetic protein FliO [Evansella cellulosilytica DSM 2522]|uniref:Flagellar protein n=1 Tax=Evansella cellulosilytica (strain ATCC 21833 / DSM 2522 / FERM P-1141 / JCM 9156 / N-4) TaxID=649639 RepID=E6TSV3_EVAC2|nr:flagellar biosynthetic protein FliO [Evansella cellulosilytica DSM 2522]
MLLPSTYLADDWGEGNGNVGDMLNRTEHEPINSDQEEGSPAIVDSTEDDETFTVENNQSVLWLTIQMFLALGFIIFLIYGLLKFVNSKSKSFRQHSTLESIGGISLGSNRSVQVVRVGDKLFVLGVGDSIQLLKEIEDQEEVERVIQENKPKEVFDEPMMKLSTWFKERLNGATPSTDEKKNFQHLLNRELKEVKESKDRINQALKEKNND